MVSSGRYSAAHTLLRLYLHLHPYFHVLLLPRLRLMLSWRFRLRRRSRIKVRLLPFCHVHPTVVADRCPECGAMLRIEAVGAKVCGLHWAPVLRWSLLFASLLVLLAPFFLCVSLLGQLAMRRWKSSRCGWRWWW